MPPEQISMMMQQQMMMQSMMMQQSNPMMSGMGMNPMAGMTTPYGQTPMSPLNQQDRKEDPFSSQNQSLNASSRSAINALSSAPTK